MNLLVTVLREWYKQTSNGRLFQTVGTSKAKLYSNYFTDLWIEGKNLGTTIVKILIGLCKPMSNISLPINILLILQTFNFALELKTVLIYRQFTVC